LSTLLVLTRKSNQSIMIGDDIEITVLSIMGEKVRIGIQAPREVPVFRKEVYLEIQEEREAEPPEEEDAPAPERPPGRAAKEEPRRPATDGASARAEVDEALRRLRSP